MPLGTTAGSQAVASATGLWPFVLLMGAGAVVLAIVGHPSDPAILLQIY